MPKKKKYRFLHKQFVIILKKAPGKKIKTGSITFLKKDGVLCVTDLKRRTRFVVPARLVKLVLIEEHTIGHLGVEKMMASLSKHLYWASMADDVANFVRQCFTCQTCKRQVVHNKVPLENLPRPTRAQEVVALDVKGPLPISEQKQYVIVAVDLFTRFAWTRAVNHVDGMAVIDFLIEEVFPDGSL